MKNQATPGAASHDYFVEMRFAPFASLPSPQEAVVFTERLVLPTLEALSGLRAAGKILAGGALLAASGFAFIVRVASPQELEEMVGGLPLWPRSQTSVTPLGAFESRAATVRARLQSVRAAAEETGAPQAARR
jgi:hypothetical protein